VVELGVGYRAEQQRHRPRRGDLRQRDDRQEQLLPLQPALLHLAEHVAPDGPVLGAVDPVVLLLLHREVRAMDLLQRVLLLRLLDGVAGAVLGYRLVVLRLPGELLDLLVSPGDALATHRHPFPPVYRGLPPADDGGGQAALSASRARALPPGQRKARAPIRPQVLCVASQRRPAAAALST